DGLDPLAGDHDLPTLVRMRVPGRAASGGGAGAGTDARGQLAIGKDDPALPANPGALHLVPAVRHLDPPTLPAIPGAPSLHRSARGSPCLAGNPDPAADRHERSTRFPWIA